MKKIILLIALTTALLTACKAQERIKKDTIRDTTNRETFVLELSEDSTVLLSKEVGARKYTLQEVNWHIKDLQGNIKTMNIEINKLKAKLRKWQRIKAVIKKQIEK